ncbi:MarR family transcriptional regulator [Dactylosporangium fulvum]|uniref:MarR family transcriptional regulator n=1 Tax=Dactylosporangium fulvum TaxID=53359 RepID=A0ABY5VXF9_9ACTN|nr:MarR family transcriptional regulator [Dactylosporangium fulvum]UWP82383.1 MarR family transcriptional regulator [Dactylosporangium fulvum]
MAKSAARRELIAQVHEGLRSFTAYAVLFSQAVADKLGLNATDSRCVDLLSRTGPVTAGKLAELTGLTTGAVTGIIDRLERAGFVRRVRDPGDRRRVIIELVPDRENEAWAHLSSVRDSVDRLLDRYDAKELTAIASFLSDSASRTAEEIGLLRRE